MFSLIERKVTKAWNKFINPQDVTSAFAISIIFLRVGGLFPYSMTNGQFNISYWNFGITLAHISAYAYVNIALLYGDFLVYAKPLIVDSSLAVVANILTKILGAVLTLVIFSSIFVGMKRLIRLLNMYSLLFDGLAELGIEATHVYRKILVVSGLATIGVFGMCLYNLIYSFSVYKRLTGEEGSLQFFYVVVLSEYYKNLCLFSIGTFFYTAYLVVSLLNEFLEEVLKKEKANQTSKERRYEY